MPFLRTLAKRSRVIGAFGLLLVSGLPASGMPFFDFHGFSYLNGPADMIGTDITVPTELNVIQPDPIWPIDFEHEEYTVLVTGLRIARVEHLGRITNIAYTGGTISLFRDPNRNAEWTPRPPNGYVPTTFKDGEAVLVGQFTDFVMVFDTRSGSGTISGSLNWTGGTRLGQIAARDGWTYFGGVSNHANLGIPEGYDLAWDPQIYGPDLPNQARSLTWGRLKDMYHPSSKMAPSGKRTVRVGS